MQNSSVRWQIGSRFLITADWDAAPAHIRGTFSKPCQLTQGTLYLQLLKKIQNIQTSNELSGLWQSSLRHTQATGTFRHAMQPIGTYLSSVRHAMQHTGASQVKAIETPQGLKSTTSQDKRTPLLKNLPPYISYLNQILSGFHQIKHFFWSVPH